MAGPLSSDLRERIVLAYEEGDKTRGEVAELFQVGRASVNRLVRRYRETGSVEPSPHGGGKPRKMTSRGEKVLRALVEERPDATIVDGHQDPGRFDRRGRASGVGQEVASTTDCG